jgi:hypothetical protein
MSFLGLTAMSNGTPRSNEAEELALGKFALKLGVEAFP